MAKGIVEEETGTSASRQLDDMQKKHDAWSQQMEEMRRSLEATRESLKSTRSSLDRTSEINRTTAANLQTSRDSIDARMSAARASLSMATEQLALGLGLPFAKQDLMERALNYNGGAGGFPGGSSDEDADLQRALAESLKTPTVGAALPALRSSFGNSTMGNSTGNSTMGNSTAPVGGPDLEDLVRCGRSLSQCDAKGCLPAGDGAADEDAELQKALAESLRTSTVATAPPAVLSPTEDEDEELRRAIAVSLGQSMPESAAASKPAQLAHAASRPQTPVDPLRVQIAERLFSKAFMNPSDPLFMHGRAYKGPLHAPTKIWESKEAPREDHGRPDWLTASEFEDSPEVAKAKVQQLAELMRLSKKTVLYTGAGISASVIGQAALSGQNKVGWKANTREAQPTPTHMALGLLGKEGMIHSWVQQNHDGLPQKAGFPQEAINEIHGSWYDPSNPVVKYSGSLHKRAAPWMVEDAETADLVIVLGTSLSGLNADQVANKTAGRSLLPPPPPEGTFAAGAQVLAAPPGFTFMHKGVISTILDDGDFLVQFEDSSDGPVLLPAGSAVEILPRVSPALGTVCINLQQTPKDGEMSLRLFGKSDDLLQMLLKELGFGMQKLDKLSWPKDSHVLVPYDKEGRRLTDPKAKKMWLDLRKGQKVRITPGHNIQGAKQPMYMHIGATKPITLKSGEERQPGVGLGHVVEREDASASFVLHIEGVTMRLGIWWMEAAMRGAVDVLPIVNEDPAFESAEGSEEPAPAAKAFARPSVGGPRRKSRAVTPP